MAPNACLCYSCDKNYLLPTVVSSLQARENLSRDLADVVVLVVGGFHDPRRAIANLLKENDVTLQILNPSDTEGLSVQFVRHMLDKLLAPRYQKIIHVDSDTQISGSLDPLFQVDLPSGHLMASPDPMAIRIHESSRNWTSMRKYFESIGIPAGQIGRYINTGIFGGARGDLADASRECVSLFHRHRDALRFHEQDCLNIVVGERFKHLSMKWNFASFFLGCGFENLLQPRIIHFMSNPRPWHGPFSPWGKRAYDVYVQQTDQQPDLLNFQTRISRPKAVKYRLQQMVKRAIESRTWTRSGVIRRIAELEQGAIV